MRERQKGEERGPTNVLFVCVCQQRPFDDFTDRSIRAQCGDPPAPRDRATEKRDKALSGGDATWSIEPQHTRISQPLAKLRGPKLLRDGDAYSFAKTRRVGVRGVDLPRNIKARMDAKLPTLQFVGAIKLRPVDARLGQPRHGETRGHGARAVAVSSRYAKRRSFNGTLSNQSSIRRALPRPNTTARTKTVCRSHFVTRACRTRAAIAWSEGAAGRVHLVKLDNNASRTREKQD